MVTDLYAHTHMHTQSSPSSAHGHALPPLIAEEKLLFGLIATHPLIKTLQELDRMYTRLDVTAIRREVGGCCR